MTDASVYLNPRAIALGVRRGSCFAALRLAGARWLFSLREIQGLFTSPRASATESETVQKCSAATAFNIDLIDPAMGMKLFTSHSRTPTTTRTINTCSNGISFLPLSLYRQTLRRVPSCCTKSLA
jgi:hypothetical protein